MDHSELGGPKFWANMSVEEFLHEWRTENIKRWTECPIEENWIKISSPRACLHSLSSAAKRCTIFFAGPPYVGLWLYILVLLVHHYIGQNSFGAPNQIITPPLAHENNQVFTLFKANSNIFWFFFKQQSYPNTFWL